MCVDVNDGRILSAFCRWVGGVGLNLNQRSINDQSTHQAHSASIVWRRLTSSSLNQSTNQPTTTHNLTEPSINQSINQPINHRQAHRASIMGDDFVRSHIRGLLQTVRTQVKGKEQAFPTFDGSFSMIYSYTCSFIWWRDRERGRAFLLFI